ncbi:MAG TPA: isoprenoid biosynthesis glyoxalase ElbB [Bacteroidales bacterium]|nr:isoprenoid biosynthesis glyoxalase ElbB [Bacteroidales bacterium]HRZ47962.1 isoprenoid biosynthesis glyoxalase ElbB [Bacteroidales bacterium]
MKKFAVVLSGCGVYDGTEIHEAVLTMLAIDRLGHEYDLFAPDMQHHHVKNHLTGEVMQEWRNVLVESARIARSNIKALDKLLPEYYDALVFPGGFGAAKNLSTFAFDGAACDVLPDVERVIRHFAAVRKPIGALCIAPAIVSVVLEGATVTIGTDQGTIAQIEKAGSKHRVSTHGEVVYDPAFNLFSTPCYMLDARISQIAEGAENLIREMVEKGM